MQSTEARSEPEAAERIPRGRSSLRRRLAAILAVAVVLAAVLAYVVAGFAFAATRIGNADSTLNIVISHQNSLNKSLNDVYGTFSALSTSSTYNPTQAKAAVDQWVAGTNSAAATIDRDDAALASASDRLNDLRWLTTPSRSSLDREARRIAHARLALVSARTVAADYMQDGQFWEAFIKSVQDFDAVITAVGGADWTTARTNLDQMKVDVATARRLSTAPALPADLQSAMTDFQSLAADYGKLVDASQAGDDAGVSTASSLVGTDANRLSSYNYDKIDAAITGYYKPLIDAFNSEMAKATS